MTHKDKDDVIQAYCRDHGFCKNCDITEVCDRVRGDFIHCEQACNEAYNIITGHKEDVRTPDPNANVDIVNHPPHYCREGSMECIEEMELIFGKEAVKHFCLCNAWKYRYRSSAKNGEEDIKKSDWYIRKYKELTSNE